MADNWNEQELQTLFRKHLPIKQMSPEFADQLKKQVLAEVAATLGPNPVASVATEETQTNLVPPVRERALPVKPPRSVAAPARLSWLEWLRERLRITPSLTMAGAVALAIWAFVLWGDVFMERMGILEQTQTSSSGGSPDTLPPGTMAEDPAVVVPITATATVASSVALAPTLTETPAAEEPVVAIQATPQPGDVPTDEEATPTSDTIVVTTIATGTSAGSGWNEDVNLAPPDETDTVTPQSTPEAVTTTAGTNNGGVASLTPVNTTTPTRVISAVVTPNGSPTSVGTRAAGGAGGVTPTTSATTERSGTATPTPVGTRIVSVPASASATPVTLTLSDIVATRVNSVLNPTLTPFEPTSTPVATSGGPILVPSATPTPVSIRPWKSPTPTLTATNTLAPVDTDTPEPTPTRLINPTFTPVEPTLTDSPLPTASNTALPTATNTAVIVPTNTRMPTLVPTNTPVPPATNTRVPTTVPTTPPLPTSTPAPTNTFAPTSTPVPPTATPTWPPTPTATWTDTPVPPTPTDTPVPPTPTPTDTPVPPTPMPTTVNLPPVVVSIPLPSILKGQEYIYLVTAVDPDNPLADIQFSLVEAPAWLQLDPPLAGMAKLHGVPPDPGEYTVKIQIWDGASAPFVYEFKISVIALPLDDIIPSDIISGGQGSANPNPNSDVQASNSVTETGTLSNTTPAN